MKLLGEVRFGHRLGARSDGHDDVLIAGAAAEITLQLLADDLIGEVVPLAVNEVDRGHDHAGRAEAALQTMMLAKRFLHRMQRRTVRRQALDGLDLVAVSHDSKRSAGFY